MAACAIVVYMRHAEAIITSRMQYAVTFDPFVFLKNIEVCMRKDITAHARLKKGAYHPEIQKSIALAGTFFLRKKRHHANRRYVGIRFIPFSRRSARVTLTHFSPTTMASFVILLTIRVLPE